MARRIGIEVSEAVAIAVKLANVDMVSAHPIITQTHIVVELANLVANESTILNNKSPLGGIDIFAKALTPKVTIGFVPKGMV